MAAIGSAVFCNLIMFISLSQQHNNSLGGSQSSVLTSVSWRELLFPSVSPLRNLVHSSITLYHSCPQHYSVSPPDKATLIRLALAACPVRLQAVPMLDRHYRRSRAHSNGCQTLDTFNVCSKAHKTPIQ